MGEDHHDELIRFSDAALIVPRSVLSQAVDDKRLTLYRRKRTLLLAREQVMKLKHEQQQPDLSILSQSS